MKMNTANLDREICKRRAWGALDWPGMNDDITDMVNTCATCQTHRPAIAKESLLNIDVSAGVWDTVRADTFTLLDRDYVAILDPNSNYPEVEIRTDATSYPVILKHKATFARFGISQVVRTDNGSQPVSRDFKPCADAHDLNIRLLNTCRIMGLKMGQANSECLECGKSPVELVLGCQVQNQLPQPQIKQGAAKEQRHKQVQKERKMKA